MNKESFLRQETGKSEDMGGGARGSHAAMDIDGGDGVREREESEPVRLLEPGPNSPTIRCTTAGRDGSVIRRFFNVPDLDGF